MEPYIAEIRLFAGNFAPEGWAFCDGQLLSIAQHTAVFSLLGTTYGGNGQTNFALPDLRARAPMGVGQGPGLSYRLSGEVAGSASTALTVQNLPPHDHGRLGVVGAAATADAPGGRLPAVGGAWGPAGSGSMGQTAQAGSSAPFSLEKPHLPLNFIICLWGIFPSRP